ncbi:MAG: hypothetical protein AAGK23_11045 [Pseudomonadota bacterium]
MFANLQAVLTSFAILSIGVAVGGAWICAIAAPNVFFDKLDAGRANTQVRALILSGSTPISGLLLAGGCCAILGGALGAGILSLLAAVGFFMNRWTLAPAKKGDRPPGARTSRKGQRVVAVSLSLLFMAVGLVAGVLAIFGI